MKFSSIEQLIEGLETKEILTHQIKGKRLRKQLKGLSEMEPSQFAFDSFEIMTSAICIYVHSISIQIKVQVEEKVVDLILRVDFQYPFNQPQIYYINNGASEYRYCKDLLPSILDGKIWGPSLTLPLFLEKIADLAKKLIKKQKMEWSYHKSYDYGREQMLRHGVKLFAAEEYRWDFKVIKNTRKKVIGLTPDSFLLFEELEDQNMRLEFWETIGNLKQVKATMGKNKYSLEFQIQEGGKMYLGGNSKDIDEILGLLNPIQMIERKLQNSVKAGGSADYEETIQMYSTLIQHYSLVDKAKMQKYVAEMKKVIGQHFQQEQYGKEQKMVEIET